MVGAVATIRTDVIEHGKCFSSCQCCRSRDADDKEAHNPVVPQTGRSPPEKMYAIPDVTSTMLNVLSPLKSASSWHAGELPPEKV